MLTVVLSGEVGAGKSTLARIWRSQGANVVGADEIAKEQWHQPEIVRQMTARWGDAALSDGRPDYAKIARVAFSNEEEYRFTNALIHPGTRVELKRRVSALRGWIVAEIPLLFEGGGHDWIDGVVYATAPLARRVAQNAHRGWDVEEIRRRERFLMDSAEKAQRADIVLANDGDLQAWTDKAEALGRLFARMADVCELSVHCGSPEEAEKIAERLLENRLIACANIGPVQSVYTWNGERHRAREWALVAKTTETALRPAMHLIRELHSYDLPAIATHELYRGDFATLRWVAESCI